MMEKLQNSMGGMGGGMGPGIYGPDDIDQIEEMMAGMGGDPYGDGGDFGMGGMEF